MAEIYPRDAEAPVAALSGKLAEEFAELARALRLYRRALSPRNGPSDRKGAAKGLDVLRGDFSEEFADAFSRLCVLGRRVLGEDISLDQLVWNVYESGCPTCRQRLTDGVECVCDTIEANSESVVLWNQAELLGKPGPPTQVNIHILNHPTASAESSASAIVEVQIQAGDFGGVTAALKAQGVDEVDIAELRTALQADPKPEGTAALGANVASWIGKMVTKAAQGTWQIGLASAASLLTKIIAAYYGIPG